MANKKSYWMKSKGGNVASVTFEGSKKPSKKVVEALSTMIDLAVNHVPKPETYPCPNCQGCGCTTCGGFGTLTY